MRTSNPNTPTGTRDRTTASRPEHEIAFAGDAGVGRTTVATLVADRLADRTRVTVDGEASAFVNDRDTSGDPDPDPDPDPDLELDWRVVDLPAGPAAIREQGATADTVFVVATKATLDSVSAYERVAAEVGVDCLLVVTRFTEADRERLRAFDGPELAEYVYEDDAIETAMAAGTVPTLDDWTTEAILLESLQPERFDADAAIAALVEGRRSIVNVEVATREEGDALVDRFDEHGYAAAYFRCNCRCHDGHVLAMEPATDRDDAGPLTQR